MSVQAALSSAGDFIQAAVSSKTDKSDQNAASSPDGSKSDFKNVLMSVRGEKPLNSNPRAGTQKSFAAGVAMTGEPKSDNAILLFELASVEEGCPEMAAESCERGASRFDPDLILGNLDVAPEVGIASVDGSVGTKIMGEGADDEQTDDESTEDAPKPERLDNISDDAMAKGVAIEGAENIDNIVPLPESIRRMTWLSPIKISIKIISRTLSLRQMLKIRKKSPNSPCSRLMRAPRTQSVMYWRPRAPNRCRTM